MEKIIELLTEINDSYDYREETALFSERKLDSFDLVGLISELREYYKVDIPAHLITAEHFDSALSIYHLIMNLKERE